MTRFIKCHIRLTETHKNSYTINSSMKTTMPATYIDEAHWDDLYVRIHDAYVECSKNHNPTYELKLAQVLDHMIRNKKYLNIRGFQNQSSDCPTDS